MTARRKQQGFTLIELLVVLFIMILGFTALAFSVSSGTDTAKLNATARDMVSALRYARGQALMTRQQTTLAFDLDDNSYQLSNRDENYRIDPDIELTLVTAESELTGEAQANVRFFPDGSCTGGRITLTRGAAIRQIDLNWLTGHVELESK
ncbi:prepilin-type N-terminal cleavage/methylation domain-containing protein [Methylosoma difficile]